MKRSDIEVGKEYAAYITDFDRSSGTCLMVPKALKVILVAKEGDYNECGIRVPWGSRVPVAALMVPDRLEGYTEKHKPIHKRHTPADESKCEWRPITLPTAAFKCEWKTFAKERTKRLNMRRLELKKANDKAKAEAAHERELKKFVEHMGFEFISFGSTYRTGEHKKTVNISLESVERAYRNLKGGK